MTRHPARPRPAPVSAGAPGARPPQHELAFSDKAVSVVRIFQNGNYSIRIGTSESTVFRAIGIAQIDDNRFAKQLQDSPLWKGPPALRDNRVLVADDNVWIAGLGYKAAGLVMDDLARFFEV